MEFHPIAGDWSLMEGDEFTSLVESVKTHGVMVPCWKFEGKILDGRNRWRAAQEAGVQVMNWHTFNGTEAEARELAKLLNDERRHLTREDRAMWVRKLREKGMSLHSIADAVGVSHTTVKRDIDAGLTHVQPEPSGQQDEPGDGPCEEPKPEPRTTTLAPAAPSASPPKVTGLDGKKYPAAKAKPEPPPVSAPEMDPEREQKLRGQAVEAAHEAINCLQKIRRYNPGREAAMKMVAAWIRNNIQTKDRT